MSYVVDYTKRTAMQDQLFTKIVEEIANSKGRLSMGITGEYYRKSAGNSVRDRRAPVTFDSTESGSRGRFPLSPLRLAGHPRLTQGSIPLPQKTAQLDGPRRLCRGSNAYRAQMCRIGGATSDESRVL